MNNTYDHKDIYTNREDLNFHTKITFSAHGDDIICCFHNYLNVCFKYSNEILRCIQISKDRQTEVIGPVLKNIKATVS